VEDKALKISDLVVLYLPDVDLELKNNNYHLIITAGDLLEMIRLSSSTRN
jgi:hypothetical protein